MRTVRSLPSADAEIDDILRSSIRRFGPEAARRYDALLRAAFEMIAEDAGRPAATLTLQGRRLIGRMHLRFARERAGPDRVGRPRHFVYYEVLPTEVLILRIVHDARDQRRLRFPRN